MLWFTHMFALPVQLFTTMTWCPKNAFSCIPLMPLLCKFKIVLYSHCLWFSFCLTNIPCNRLCYASQTLVWKDFTMVVLNNCSYAECRALCTAISVSGGKGANWGSIYHADTTKIEIQMLYSVDSLSTFYTPASPLAFLLLSPPAPNLVISLVQEGTRRFHPTPMGQHLPNIVSFLP